MTLPELERALSWAAAEGWNPGLADARAFYAADPAGFLMGWLDDTPIAAISAVRHSDSFGFLGLYVCLPEFRGQGYGWQIWQAAMQLFGSRTIGLDGVLEQQANYAKSGFALAHNSQRYVGLIDGGPIDGFTVGNVAEMVERDARISGLSRPRYMQSWFTDCDTRHTLSKGAALGTIRQCGSGYKIGPLYAPDAEAAEGLVRALVSRAGADGVEVSVDAPSHNLPANEMCKRLGLTPVFATARMYKGADMPKTNATEFGITTMELG